MFGAGFFISLSMQYRYVVLPDAKCYYITVFECDSYESDAVNASIIATVSSLVYKYMSNIYTR